MNILPSSRYLLSTVLLSILFISQACTQVPNVMEDLSVEAFASSMDGKTEAILLDVRTPGEWEEGFI